MHSAIPLGAILSFLLGVLKLLDRSADGQRYIAASCAQFEARCRCVSQSDIENKEVVCDLSNDAIFGDLQ